ncbi:MAG: hypothetical protein AB1505_23180 [Candidatus Latescibacterota bacterium]
MTLPYATHASEGFNARLQAGLDAVGQDVARVLGANLVALVLGGGYGRGEGGVVVRDGVEHPYNDLDLTLVVQHRGQVAQGTLRRLAVRHGEQLGLEVDFSRPLTPRAVRHWPPWLMWHDLLHGHVVLHGPRGILPALAPAVVGEPLPAIEATRLLVNRGAGLLWALRVTAGVEPPPDPDFVRRNYYKCALALGDALLIAHGCYATPCRGRGRRLRRLEGAEETVAALGLRALYDEALRFKFRPDLLPAGEGSAVRLRQLAERWGAVFLHVERVRTGARWRTLEEYAGWEGAREPEQNRPAMWPRNALQNRRLGGWSLRYPREALYRQLPGLLGLTRSQDATWVAGGQRFLRRWKRCS